MTTIDGAMTAVRAYLAAGGSRAKLAKAAGVHRNTVLAASQPGWVPTLRTIRRLSDGLKTLGMHHD